MTFAPPQPDPRHEALSAVIGFILLCLLCLCAIEINPQVFSEENFDFSFTLLLIMGHVLLFIILLLNLPMEVMQK